METYLDAVREWIVGFGPRLLAALLIYVVGWSVARVLCGVVQRILARAQFDETLSLFLSRLAYMAVLAFAVVATIQKLGVDTTSFAALYRCGGFGDRSLAPGLARKLCLGCRDHRASPLQRRRLCRGGRHRGHGGSGVGVCHRAQNGGQQKNHRS